MIACLCAEPYALQAASWIGPQMLPGYLRGNKARFSNSLPNFFPLMPCLRQWIHFASCHPKQKCGNNIVTPFSPLQPSPSPRDPVSSTFSRLGLSLYPHPHTNCLLFPLCPALSKLFLHALAIHMPPSCSPQAPDLTLVWLFSFFSP